jgi:homoserine O-acetyltransferase
MKGDTAVVETAAGTQRVPTRAGAVPSFNNAVAISELFTRRARATGGFANIPYFALNGGTTLDVRVRPVSADSVTVSIAQQVQRFKVDPMGRIIGGIIVGPGLEFARLGPEAAEGLTVTLRDTTIAPKPDYSAPSGAPYLADPFSVVWRERAPEISHLRFETTKGVFVLELHRAWGPIGADRVYNLARLGYYNDTRLHRVRADIAHFGIHGDPAVNAVWSKAELVDDPPRSTNRRGTFALAFPARPNSRTTQIYINKTDNPRSDADAFTVLGTVVEGMAVVDSLYAGYGEESGGGMRQGKQGPLLEGGNAFMDRAYPRLDRILRVTVRTVR